MTNDFVAAVVYIIYVYLYIHLFIFWQQVKFVQ